MTSRVYRVNGATAIAPSPQRPPTLDRTACVFSHRASTLENPLLEYTISRAGQGRLRVRSRTYTSGDLCGDYSLATTNFNRWATPSFPATSTGTRQQSAVHVTTGSGSYAVQRLASPSRRRHLPGAVDSSHQSAPLQRDSQRVGSTAVRGHNRVGYVGSDSSHPRIFRDERSLTSCGSSVLSSDLRRFRPSIALARQDARVLRRSETAGACQSDFGRFPPFATCLCCGDVVPYARPEMIGPERYCYYEQAYRSRSELLRNANAIPTCLACRRSGRVDMFNSEASLYAIFRRVIAFYRTVLKIELLPLLMQAARESRLVGRNTNLRLLRLSEAAVAGMDGLTRDQTVQEAIDIELVDLQFFEANSGVSNASCGDLQQLARSDCRSAIRQSTQTELGRWVDKIYVIRGLAFEALGGIIAHELMHVYMWLKRSEGSTQDFDEALCNMAAMEFLRTEASLLEKARERGDARWQVSHRESVCRYRMAKLHELQSKPAYLTELQLVESLLEVHGGSFPAVVASQIREGLAARAQPTSLSSAHSF